MKTSWLAIPAIALTLGFASTASAAVTQPSNEIERFEEFFKMADGNKDGMMSRQEFVTAAGRRYDQAMAQMKKMGDKSQAMMKGEQMTKEGAKMLYMEFHTFGL